MWHVAVDLGASGGKIFLGRIQNDSLVIEEVHRFDNRPIQADGRYCWDVTHIYHEVVRGLEKAEEEASEIDSLGVDTWGLDFGFMKGGKLIRNPYSYRDPELASTIEDILEEVPRKSIFTATGINHWNVTNSLWQYHYLSRKEPKALQESDRIVMIPQLISSMLGGRICGEETIASTTQMLDPISRTWATELLCALELPIEKLPEVEEPGTKIGVLKEEVSKKIGSRPDILLPASHDTAAAVAGMPLEEGNRAFLSTGSWFILGAELEEPCLTDEAFEIEASNEMGVEGTSRFLKNINGFFLLEECRKRWRKRNQIHEYGKLVDEASKAKAFGPLIDPDDESFTIKGDMTEKIASYCRGTGQEVPESEGEISRCIFESLAAKTALTLEDLMEVSNVSSERLHLGGGGARNELFCQMVSSAARIPVYAEPVEAAAVGNILTQAKARSEIGDIEEGRRLVEKSLEIRKYEPEKSEEWEEVKGKMRRLMRDLEV
ncbi:rhamnulokinase [candidate division MSBL1 archaeon SCGC-AAA259A05]|uniref:Rhamnulokinase n=1 Tax=candidate division MSBL1 archaeon SCGC-AAA259A05 TaxID=1698259 RepID=A0A133U3B0_9EURY|nr:rhamnulokinase [candidate division MSBL1 archaeon SCGC-AAA259A05]